jgi:hypothetical protein
MDSQKLESREFDIRIIALTRWEKIRLYEVGSEFNLVSNWSCAEQAIYTATLEKLQTVM